MHDIRQDLMPPRSLCALLGASLLMWALPASAQETAPPPQEVVDEEAFQKEAQRARELYAEEKFDEAIAAFESAYALKPEPNILYNIGRIHEKKGEFEQATDYYERFVNEPDIKLAARQDALARIKALREVLAMRAEQEARDKGSEPRTDSQSSTTTSSTTPTDQPLDTSPVEPPVAQKPGIVPMVTLVGLGAGSLIVGGIFARRTQVAHEQYEQTTDLEESCMLRAQGRRDAIIADAGLIAGVALIATGVTLRVIQLRRFSSEVTITSNFSSDRKQIGLHLSF